MTLLGNRGRRGFSPRLAFRAGFIRRPTLSVRAPLHAAMLGVVEHLERRCLLSADTTDTAYIWTHLKPAAQHDIGVIEYNDPVLKAALDAQLIALGIDPIPAQPGTLPDPSTGKAKHHHPRPHKLNLFHQKPKKHHRKTGPTPPTVTNVNYYYDQPLPNQIAFTFDQDVTASSWNSAVSVIDLNTGTTLAVSGTYSSALHTAVFNLNSSAELSNGNYAAILHSAQITDTTNGLAVVGSDSVSGHDVETSFFFQNTDFNHDRNTDIFDLNALLPNYNTSGKTFSQGDSNYDGNVDVFDLMAVLGAYNTSLPLLGSVTATTAYVASSSSADIFWDAPSDTLVTGYDLYRDSTRIASDITDTAYLDTGLSYNTTYNYFVVGVDGAGNSSFESPEAYIAIAPSTPTLSLTGDASVTEGETYYLGGAFGNANNDEPNAWAISWGDGTSATYTGFASAVLDANDQIGGPADATHTYAEGTYTITGSALSDIGTYAANSLVVTVSDATPTFSVLGDQTFVQGQPYTVNPSFSDFDSPVNWTVAWGDGSSNSTGTGTIPRTLTHTYTSGASAPYTLNAYVTTVDGTYTNSTSVDVAAPSLSITGATSVQQGATYTLTDTFSDPSGLTPGTWSIDWGDGSTTTTSGSTASFTHAYSQALESGGYTVAAYAVDSNGTYYSAPDYVTVAAVTPTVSITASSPVSIGSALVLTNHSTDPAGDYVIEGWTIAWGDGKTSYYTENPNYFAHTYAVPGSHSVAATAQTPGGTYVQTLTVNVLSDASAWLSAGYATQSKPYYVDVGFHESGSAQLTGYVISWGDGATTSYGTEPNYGGWGSHVYHTYGTLTLDAQVQTTDGTYDATATVTVLPNLGYQFRGMATAESGHAYDLAVNYDGADPLPTYTVNWGDGSSTTSTSRGVLSHAYIFDPDFPYSATWNYNARPITLTASEGAATYTSLVWTDVYRGGSGLTVSGDTSATEGQTFHATGTFSDSNQAPTYLPGASAWDDSWGDMYPDSGISLSSGSLTWSTAGFSHIYNNAGAYTIQYGAIYEDSPLPHEMVIDQTVNVSHTPGTVGLTAPTTAWLGQAFSADALFTPAPGANETVGQWAVAWGDGHSTVSPASFTHNYESAGSFTIDATLTTNEGTYNVSRPVSVVAPVVSVARKTGAPGFSSEAGVEDLFVVSRNLVGDQPLDVYYSLSGSADSSDYVLEDANTGQIFTGAITIPAGSAFCTIAVVAKDDQTPEWTESLDLQLTGSAVGGVAPFDNSVSTEIVDNDLGITLGNGSGNIILQGSSDGKSNLVPLVLNFPATADQGAAITLSTSADNEADVWTTPTPGDDDHPILGNDDGTYHSSVSWTYSPNAPSESTFWVGGTNGSFAMNDIQFALKGSDLGSFPAPNTPSTNVAQSRTATDFGIKIISKYNPNDDGLPTSLDVTRNATPRPWLVGQIVDLYAVIVAPTTLVPPTFEWSVPGTVLYDYSDNDARAVKTDLLPNNNFLDPLGGIGTRQSEISFFWVRTDNPLGPEEKIVTLTATSILFHVSIPTTFELFTPIVSAGPVNEPATIIDENYKRTPQSQGAPVVSLGAPGVDYFDYYAEVDLPAFNVPGRWKFVQTMQTDLHATVQDPQFYVNGSLYPPFAVHLPSNSLGTILDTKDPYDGTYFTGTSGTFSDEPKVGFLNQPAYHNVVYSMTTNIITANINMYFNIYIMFQAPGSSKWVPVGAVAWNWSAAAHRSGSHYVLDSSSGPDPSDLTTSVDEPLWTSNFYPPKRWLQD